MEYFIWGNAYFWLTMHQNVNVKLFLNLDHFVNFFLDGIYIIIFRDPILWFLERKGKIR